MGATLALTAVSPWLVVISILRFGAGLFGGAAFVVAGSVAARLSAFVHESVSAVGLDWRTSWLALGLLCAATAPLLAFVLGDHEEMPVTLASSDAARGPSTPSTASVELESDRSMRRLEIAYGLFGLGYISYVTFAVVYLEDAPGAMSTTMFWTVVGGSSVVASLVWPLLIQRTSSRAMFPVTLAACSLGVASLVLSQAPAATLVSAVLFGGSFIAVVSTVTGAARDLTPPNSWTRTIGRLTVIFGIGQTLGPLAAGALGDTASGVRLGLAASAVALALGAVSALPGRVRAVHISSCLR